MYVKINFLAIKYDSKLFLFIFLDEKIVDFVKNMLSFFGQICQKRKNKCMLVYEWKTYLFISIMCISFNSVIKYCFNIYI